MIKSLPEMKQSGDSLEDITSLYIERYKDDMRVLHVKDADIEQSDRMCG